MADVSTYHAVSASRRWRDRFKFQSILEVTADKAGEEFLRHLVRELAQVLEVSHAFVAEFAGSKDRVRTIAFWGESEWMENLEYDLAGTPCSDVIESGLLVCRDQVQRKYPADAVLRTLGVRGYLGVALATREGDPIGHLAVMDRQPLARDPHGLDLLRLFAERARIEFERMGSEHALRETFDKMQGELRDQAISMADARRELDLAHDELAALLRINQAVSRGLDRDELFGALAANLSPLVATDRFGIEIPLGEDRLRGHLLTPIGGVLPTRTDAHVLPSVGTACAWVIERRELWISGSREEIRTLFPTTFNVMSREGVESLCVLPLTSGDCRAALFFMAETTGAYQSVRRRLLEEIASAVAVALDNCLVHEDLRALRDQLAAENQYLQEEIRHQHNFEEIVGRSLALQRTLREAELVAPTDATVLIQGETGTGKELVARALHARGARSDHPLVKVNCAAIAAGLVESELFGHEKGAFTGATRSHTGRFELADRGTIFLDEVGELPADAQVKLLRVLQEREFERVGGSQTRKVDVRVIAATNRNLSQEVREGRFREDLFYRLNVFPIVLPPLRDRVDDIPLLAQFFLDRSAPRIGRSARRISDVGLERLREYSWPGNVRELENVIERALILCPGATLELGDEVLVAVLPQTDGPGSRLSGSQNALAANPDLSGETLQELQRRHVQETLQAAGGRIEGPRGAAQALGLSPSTLRSLMKRLGIQRPITGS